MKLGVVFRCAMSKSSIMLFIAFSISIIIVSEFFAIKGIFEARKQIMEANSAVPESGFEQGVDGFSVEGGEPYITMPFKLIPLTTTKMSVDGVTDSKPIDEGIKYALPKIHRDYIAPADVIGKDGLLYLSVWLYSVLGVIGVYLFACGVGRIASELSGDVAVLSHYGLGVDYIPAIVTIIAFVTSMATWVILGFLEMCFVTGLAVLGLDASVLKDETGDWIPDFVFLGVFALNLIFLLVTTNAKVRKLIR